MKLPFTNASIQFPAKGVWHARRLVAGTGLLLCILTASSVVRAELVDRIVAAVNNDVITASDLAHAVALNMRFGGASEDRKTLELDTLQGLITRRLLVQEARRLRYVDVSDDEISAENDKLRKQFGSDQAFADFLTEQDMTGQELRRMLGERLLVERFVEKKVGIFARVSRDEAQSYFEEHAAEYKNMRFQDVQKTIIALLTDRKIEKQLNQYVTELRSKADVRINTR
jgi:SurA N-terminal domain